MYSPLAAFYCLLIIGILAVLALISAGIGFVVYRWQDLGEQPPSHSCAALLAAGIVFIGLSCATYSILFELR